MPPRLGALGAVGACAFALGCHTVDAVRRIARPSPVTAVSVEPGRGRVAWLAEYRAPPGDLDPVVHGFFVRGVTKRGHLEVDPASTCVLSAEHDDNEEAPLRGREPLLVRGSSPPAPAAARSAPPEACQRELRLQLSRAARYPEAEAIVAQDRSGQLLLEVDFPTERPSRDPRRWGWLAVAPALDATTIALAIPYAAVVVLFESLIVAIGPLQLENVGFPVLVLTTTDERGNSKDRALVRIESDQKLFVAANHWPRAWYHRALRNPEVQVTLDGERADYRAVPASDEEIARIDAEFPAPIAMRILTGFPPRSFLRLDPR